MNNEGELLSGRSSDLSEPSDAYEVSGIGSNKTQAPVEINLGVVPGELWGSIEEGVVEVLSVKPSVLGEEDIDRGKSIGWDLEGKGVHPVG